MKDKKPDIPAIETYLERLIWGCKEMCLCSLQEEIGYTWQQVETAIKLPPEEAEELKRQWDDFYKNARNSLEFKGLAAQMDAFRKKDFAKVQEIRAWFKNPKRQKSNLKKPNLPDLLNSRILEIRRVRLQLDDLQRATARRTVEAMT